MSMPEPVTVVGFVGLLMPLLIAVASRYLTNLRSTYKRLLSIIMTVLVAGLLLWELYSPGTWQQIVVHLAAAVGAMQLSFTLFKGFWDKVEGAGDPQ